MQCKREAPLGPSTASGGYGKVPAQFIPLPFESVKQVCPRIARRVQSRMIDRVASAGWPWDVRASLMVDALQVHIEEAEDPQGVAA
jgi:hypothetical protein